MKTLEMCSQAELDLIVAELEACLPPESDHEAAKAHAIGGGLFGKVQRVIADIKAKDWDALALDVGDLVTYLIGSPTLPQSMQQQAAAALKIDWKKLVATLLGQLLPLILGGVGA